MVVNGEKKCSKCGKTKSVNDFYKRKQSSDGYNWNCKECIKNFQHEYRSKNGEHERKREKNRRILFKQINPCKSWARKTLDTHRSKGYKVNITTDELVEIAKKTKECLFCGRKINFSEKERRNRPSLDRVNNEKVINKDNVMIVCFLCNKTKGERTLKEFLDFCKKVARISSQFPTPTMYGDNSIETIHGRLCQT